MPTMQEFIDMGFDAGSANMLARQSDAGLFDAPAAPAVDLSDPRIDIAFAGMGDVGGPTNGQTVGLPTEHAAPVSFGGNVPVPVPVPVGPGVPPILDTATILIREGMDVRDVPIMGGSVGAIAPAVGITLAAARVLLRTAMGGARRITAAHWSRLPGWAQSLLAGVGLGIGIDLALDIPGIPGESFLLPGGGGGSGEPHFGQHMIEGHIGVSIVGGWVANGVQFYRLSDGKLAVINKKGRWKVWKPKKPIVIMPGGATNLKTLLRADAVLNRQAKRIATMLNRRAPRSRKAGKSGPQGPTIIQADGKVINT